MTHYLKLELGFCDAVCDGEKIFEVRKNDRGFQKGDTVIFSAYQSGMFRDHPINDKKYTITYVLSGWGIEPGFVVFGIKEI